MLRVIEKEEYCLVSGGDLEMSLDDSLFAGENFETITGMSVTDNEDGSYQVSLTFDDGYYGSATQGQTQSRTVTQTVVRDSGQTTVSGTFSGKLTLLGKGFNASGQVTATSPRTVTTTSVTTSRTGSTGPGIKQTPPKHTSK